MVVGVEDEGGVVCVLCTGVCVVADGRAEEEDRVE